MGRTIAPDCIQLLQELNEIMGIKTKHNGEHTMRAQLFIIILNLHIHFLVNTLDIPELFSFPA